MGRAKRKRLIAETIEQMQWIDNKDTLTFRSLEVHWSSRTVVFNGRRIECGPEDSIVFPVLDTTKLIVLPHGGEVVG